MGTGMGAAGARVRLDCWLACRMSFCEGGWRSGMGTAMAKGVLGLSRALPRGLLSWAVEAEWAWAWAEASDLTLSLLFCLVRAKVATERTGREAFEGAAGGPGAFSGEWARARVAEGVLVCEDDVLRVLSDVFVRSEAERDERSWEPRSVTDEAMLCLLEWLRRCGVVGRWTDNSYWSASRGGVASPARLAAAGWRLSVGGGCWAGACETDETDEAACWRDARDLPPKKEGRREKMLCVAAAWWKWWPSSSSAMVGRV